MASAASMVTGSSARVEGTNDSTMTSVSLSMNTSLMKTSGPFEFPEVAGFCPRGVSTKWPCTSKMNSPRAGPVCTRASWRSSAASRGTSKKPPLLPAAAFAVLKARSVLAAPQAETKNFRFSRESFFEF